jgi:uncharacterized protein (TIGR03000 family)
MYSLVMMTALTTAPSGPEFNGYFRDLFRGSSSSASQSNNCNGGGIFHGRIITALTFGGGGCTGSCTGSCTGGSCTGRSLSCNGCSGSIASHSCCGGTIARASCFGSMPGGAPIEFGSPYATPMPAYYGPIVPGFPILDPVRVEGSYKNVLPAPSATAGQRATVTIRLPADARLSVDGVPLELTGAERVFTTPELPMGRDYAYGFKIEYDRNGRTLSESQKVTVTAGKTSTVAFDDLTASAKPAPATSAAKPIEPTKPTAFDKAVPETPTNPFRASAFAANPTPARITVKLPTDAALYVDGKKHEKTGAQREFTTPPIPFGKEFAYELKLVKTRNGQPEELTQKVVFQAGETVTVDFTEVPVDRRAGK